jgi:hypothetical protein
LNFSNFIDPALVAQVEAAVKEEAVIISELEKVASEHPYYKFVSHSIIS